jgi:hypothetical protein
MSNNNTNETEESQRLINADVAELVAVGFLEFDPATDEYGLAAKYRDRLKRGGGYPSHREMFLLVEEYRAQRKQ